jgi:hypothetical protein
MGVHRYCESDSARLPLTLITRGSDMAECMQAGFSEERLKRQEEAREIKPTMSALIIHSDAVCDLVTLKSVVL